MSTIARADWETPSGFADDFDFHIDDARFGFLSNYMGGTVPLLIWEGHSPDDDGVSDVAFPIGSGWDVKANGQRVEHENGKKKFVRNSVVGHLIRRVVDELKVESVLDSAPTEAGAWKGLAFHMKREKISYPNLKKDDKEGVDTERLMPVAVLKSDSGSRSKSGSKPSAETSEKADTNGVPNANASLLKKLTLLATKLERSEFQMKALDMKEVTDDDALMASVLEDGEDGFWAVTRAKASANA